MAEKLKPGCKRPSAGAVGQTASEAPGQATEPTKEEKKMIMIGQPAPDFKAPGYHKGQFVEVSLSEFFGEGKWALLCFYPGDFTFV